MALSNVFRTTFRISDLWRILKFATADKTTCIGYVGHNISSPVKCRLNDLTEFIMRLVY